MKKTLFQRFVRSFGYHAVPVQTPWREGFPEASDADIALMKRAAPFTMTTRERRWSLIEAVRYVAANQIPGDFVEAGVWRGGSSLIAGASFAALGDTTRTLWLYDTFEGMTKPTLHDVQARDGLSAAEVFDTKKTGADRSDWCFASLEDVQATMAQSGYPPAKVRYVKGKVEDTLRDPANVPDRIALLRLDTDWYDSTKAEMDILYPRLAPGGVLILDDYGHWVGARKAVDEYFYARGIRPMLMRVDESCRVMLKAG
jgi:hypothetical protein